MSTLSYHFRVTVPTNVSVRPSRGTDLPAREVGGCSRQSSLKPRPFPASRNSVLHGLNEQLPTNRGAVPTPFAPCCRPSQPQRTRWCPLASASSSMASGSGIGICSVFHPRSSSSSSARSASTAVQSDVVAGAPSRPFPVWCGVVRHLRSPVLRSLFAVQSRSRRAIQRREPRHPPRRTDSDEQEGGTGETE